MGVIEADIRSFTYDGDDVPTLRDVRLVVERGELVVLTGNSGCGKTTLTRVLNGLAPDHYEGVLDGRVALAGTDVRAYSAGELAGVVGNVFQNPADQFFTRKAEDEVALVGENLGMPRKELRARVAEALARMGVAYAAGESLSELSGGEKQRVAIASTLVCDTQAVFFDEPSASLDARGIEELRRILIDLKSMGKTVVIAEHRLYFLADLYDRLYVMRDGRIAEVFDAGRLTAADCARHGLRAVDLRGLRAENADELGCVAASVDSARIAVRGRTLIEGLSFELRENEIMGIVGANGIGKSTLARAMCGLCGGRQEMSWGRTPRARLRSAYYMMQDVDYQLFFDTVENEVLAGRRDVDEACLEEVARIVREIDLWDTRTEHPHNLSGGQKQRLALANAFLSEKRLIVLDEPTSGLDYLHMERIASLVRALAARRPVVVITHDVELLLKTGTSALLVGPSGCEKIDVRASGAADQIVRFLGTAAR